MKIHLSKLPVLIKSELEERLWIYMSAIKNVMSLVLVWEDESEQNPVYYVSHALKGPEVRYTEVE